MPNLTREQLAELAARPNILTIEMQRQLALGAPPEYFQPQKLTDREVVELRSLAEQQREAYASRDFAAADAARAKLIAWGAWPPEKGWHPMLESSQHGKERLAARIALGEVV